MKSILVTFILSVLITATIKAQSIVDYTFGTSTSTVLEDMSSGTTQLIGPSSINIASGITDIGFSFYFMGAIYTQFSVNSNGQMSLGSNAILNTGISNAEKDTALLVPVSGGNNILSTGKVHFKINGTAPNRILIVEWKDLNIPNPIVDNLPPISEYNPSQIQVFLYESTGSIDFRYGPVYNNSVSTVTRSTFISSSNIPNTVKYIGADMISAIDASTVGTYFLNSTNTGLLTNRIYSFTPPEQLTLKVYLQGFYNVLNGTMNKCHDYVNSVIVEKFSGTITDTITVELHNEVTYSTVVYRAKGIELHQDGTCNSSGKGYISIPSVYNGNYYITIKTRNHLETTSSTPVSFATRMIDYNFTDIASKTFGNNMIFLNKGIYGLFAGDLNRDGLITVIDDRSPIQTASLVSAKGYIIQDINGDGIVTFVDDRSPVQSNFLSGVRKKDPLNP